MPARISGQSTTTRLSCPFGHRAPGALLGTVRGYAIHRCPDCRTIFVPDILTTAGGAQRYQQLYVEDEKYHTEWMKVRGYPPYRERFEHDHQLGLSRMGKILKMLPAPRGPLLDVGCANGGFLQAAVDLGVVAMGLEASAEMARFIVREHGLLAVPGCFPDWPNWPAWSGAFQVVTFHDVFEHLLDPPQALRVARQLLTSDGLLVIDTPDASCEEAETLGIRWKHVKPEEHPWLFAREPLRALLLQEGFAVVNVETPIPGKMVFYAHTN